MKKKKQQEQEYHLADLAKNEDNFLVDLYYKIYWHIVDFKYKVRMAYQRVSRGYDDTAKWNLESHLAEEIKEITFNMAEHGMGYPDSVGSQEKWTKILKQISFGFGSYIEMRSGEYIFKDKEYKRLEKEYKKGMELFSKYFPHLWD